MDKLSEYVKLKEESDENNFSFPNKIALAPIRMINDNKRQLFFI